MKKAIGLVVCLALMVPALWGHAADKPIVLSYSSGYGENFSLSMHDRWFADELAKRTNGRVKIEFYWSEALAKIPESLEAVSKGLADIQFMALGTFGGQLPLLTATSLFYQTDKPDAVSKAMMEVYRTFPPLREEIEKKNNMRAISFSGCTPLIFGSREPWNSFDNLKGKKVRTFPGLEKPLAEFGATPLAISWGEIYVSLERGVIDGYTGTMWDLAALGRFQEVAPYILDLGVGTYAAAGTFMNLATWNKLPPDIQKTIEAVAIEALDKQAELYMQADQNAYELYKKSNVKTIAFSAEEEARMQKVVVPKQTDEWIQNMEKKGLPAKEFLSLYKAAIKKHEPSSTYKSPFVRFTDLNLK